MTPTLPGVNLTIIGLFSLGFASATPYIAAFLTQSKLPRVVNEIIAFVVCLAAGLIAFWQGGGSFTSIHSLAPLAAAVSVIFTYSKVFYLRLKYNSPIIQWLKNLTMTASPSTVASPPPVDINATQVIDRSTLDTAANLPPPAPVAVAVIPLGTAPVVEVPAPQETPALTEIAEPATETAESASPIGDIPITGALVPSAGNGAGDSIPEGTEGD